MTHADKITKKLEQMNFKSTAEMREKILSEASQAMEQTINAAANKPSVRRIIMKSNITKFATAAVIAIAVFIGINMFNGTPAWAIEQSIKAQHSVRSIFVKGFQSQGNMGKGESFDFWIKYDSKGKVSQFRMDSPNSLDGAKIVVLNEERAKVWMSDKNTLMLLKGAEMTKGLEKLASDLDPKQTLQRLHDLQKKLDETELTTIRPEKDGDPVIFEVNNNTDNDYFRYFFDAETKLLIQFEKYHLVGENYELREKFEFFRYNQFIDESLFELNDIPDDALIIDQASEDVGIEKENMTDDEVAMEVVRQCLDAAIAHDYEKVKTMLGGVRGDVLEQSFGGRILQIISIDKPVTHGKWKHILCVPCKIEVENKRTGRNWIANFKPHVKRLENESGDKWSICGGY